MKKLGIVLLSFIFMLGACSDRQPGGGLPDTGPIKYDKGTDGMVLPPDGPGTTTDLPLLPPDGPPPPPPDGPPPPPPDMPVLPPDLPPPPPDLGPPPPDMPKPPQDGPVVPPPDGPVVPPTDGPVVPPPDGPVVPPADGPVIKPDMPIPPDMGPLVNDTCANAKSLSWAGAKKITVSGTTANKNNEYGTGINCGNYNTIFSGPQEYFKITLTAGVNYRITLNPKYNYAYFYIFQSCGINPINTACASSGKTGLVSDAGYNNGSTAKLFKPATSGTYYIAVDSRSTSFTYNGAYSMVIEQYTPPTNDVCSKAQKITLVNGKGSVSSSTTGANNEYGTSIGCKQTTGGQPIGMDAPQLYYKVSMTAGTTYDIFVNPAYNYSGVYIFRASSCGSATNINNDCAGGSTPNGANNLYINQSGETTKFKPTLSGDYVIAIDGRTPSYHGAFQMTVTEFKPALNTKCSNASTITLSGGKATVTGNTIGVANEFGDTIRCGMSQNYALDGSQLYYKMFMSGVKNYRIRFSPNFRGRVYVWRNTCVAASITADCGSGGKTGAVSAYTYSGQTSQILFTPPAGGTYHIAVDSTGTSSTYAGTFSFTVEEFSPPQNGTCAKAQKLVPTSNKVTVTGDTTGMTNEFGTQINCGSSSSSYIFDGNQLYYTIDLTAGQSYKFTLSPSFYAGMYIWGAGCYATAINAGCGSQGKTGDASWFVSNGSTRSVIFKAPTTATYHVAVDSTSSSSAYYGSFTLSVEKYVPPTNAICSGATLVNLGSGTTTVTGDTTGMTNEFGTAINCGNLNTIFRGTQAYYKFNLVSGKTYTFRLTASFYYNAFYIFSGSCGMGPINASCGSGGKTGDVSSTSYSTGTKTVTFTPSTTGVYFVAVDSTQTNRFGAFTLTIQ